MPFSWNLRTEFVRKFIFLEFVRKIGVSELFKENIGGDAYR